MVKVHGEEVTSSDTRTSLVYMDEDSIDLANFDFFPIISNPSKYPLYDVLLKYIISPKLAGVSITDYYDSHDIRQNLEVTNKDNKEETLHPKFTIPSPFSRFVMKDNEKTIVTLQATYKGIKEPFNYETSIYTKKLVEGKGTNRRESIYDDIKRFFKTNGIDTCDVYYLDSGRLSIQENFIGGAYFREISSDSEIEEIGAAMDENTPWYMYLGGVILVMVCLVGMYTLLFRIIRFDLGPVLTYEIDITREIAIPISEHRKSSAINPILLFIEIIVAVFLLYVIQLTYFNFFLSVESEFSWMVLGLSYTFYLGLFFFVLICKKIHKINSFFIKRYLLKTIIFGIWVILYLIGYALLCINR